MITEIQIVPVKTFCEGDEREGGSLSNQLASVTGANISSKVCACSAAVRPKSVK